MTGLLFGGATAVSATDPPALTGASALGDWHEDAPGVRRMIVPGDLPEPYATASAGNSSRIGPRPAGAMPRLPRGFAASLWATGLDTPRALRVAPNGDVFLAESGAGRVLVFRAAAGADSGGAPHVFADDLSQPYGIAFWPPGPQPRFVYVAETGRIIRYAYQPGVVAAGGPAQVIVPYLPSGGHWTRDLAVSPDGARLFVSVGSSSNVATGMAAAPPEPWVAWEAAHGLGATWGDEEGRAAVFSFVPDGPALRPFAQGLRNCSGLAMQPGAGQLWCVTNERDGMGDNLPPDYATRVSEGSFYGWPWFYIGAHPDSRPKGRRPDLASRVTVPDVLIQPHSAPLGIAFYDATPDSTKGGAALFPPAYRGDAFVTLHGSWNRAVRTGYKVVRLLMRDGKPTGAYEDFMTGFVASDSTVWARPVGVAVARDGALLVSEDGHGTIWRVAPTTLE